MHQLPSTQGSEDLVPAAILLAHLHLCWGQEEQVINCFSSALGSGLSLEKLSMPHPEMVSAIKALRSQEFD